MRAKPAVVNGDPRSLVNTNGDLILLPLQLAQGPHFIADNGMGGRRALLGPAYVQDGVATLQRSRAPHLVYPQRMTSRHVSIG